MIDTHCHLYLGQFDNDRNNVILGAVNDGVQRFLVPGIDVITSKKSIDLSNKYSKHIFSAVGIHPNYSEDSNPNLILDLLNSQRDKIYAIGEIGLDFYRDYSSTDRQIEIFKRMLEFAKIFKLPICIHNRKADIKILEILDKWYKKCTLSGSSTHRGVFHAFDGSDIVAEWGTSRGFYFGIGGEITYKNSVKMRNVVKMIGLNNLILETDAPYLSPVPFRGKRNTPHNLIYIVRTIADVFSCNIQEVINKTDENANCLFQFNK